MSELQLPDQLKGPWDHLLILTYGMDLPFFEQTLLRELPARCRNRIVLGDGAHLLEINEIHACDGLARGINHRYVAEGIFAPRAAHAKLILLVNPTQGRLMVGSGNLSWQGYASGGELFTTYEYRVELPEQLAAFVVVRELLEGLMVRRYLSDAAERYVQFMLQATPWLFQTPTAPDRPVRHNLTQSFIQQLRLEAGEEPVEELIVLSPFYDKECHALAQLLVLLRPTALTLLFQPDRTSLDPHALQRVLAEYPGQVRIQPVQRVDDAPYLHAKLILVKQRERAVCLQGSANLSQAALLLITPHGNLELVNLLSGARDAFDNLLAGLTIDPPIASVHSLNLRYEEPASTTQLTTAWRLTAAAWNGNRLRVEDRGPRPNMSGAIALLGSSAHPIGNLREDTLALEWTPSAVVSTHFDRPVTIRIRLSDGSESNPVFVCNLVTLDAALAVTAEDETLNHVGGLDLDDQELESLFGLLDSTLLIDQRSLWQAAGKQLAGASVDGDESLHLSYADIDYALLRQHPRIQQYLRGFGAARAGRTRLQVVLSAIASHLLEIIERTSQLSSASAAAAIPSTDLSEEELEAEVEATTPQRTRSQQQRLQRMLKSFIRRYLAGVTSPEFRALVGVEVLAQNYIIFSHILWRLWLKEWVEHEFLVEAFITTWCSFWGDAENASCLSEVSPATREQIDALLREHYTISTLLSGLYDSAFCLRTWGWDSQRGALRDFWRAFLAQHAALITLEVLEQTWYALSDVYPHDTPLPSRVIEELAVLASFETANGFLRALETQHGFSRGSCRFERVEVHRETLGRKTLVACLVIDSPDALRELDQAVALIGTWMRFQHLDYYRIVAPGTHKTERVVLYEVSDQEGILWDNLAKRGITLDHIILEPSLWGETLIQLRALAEQVQMNLRIPQIANTPSQQAKPVQP